MNYLANSRRSTYCVGFFISLWLVMHLAQAAPPSVKIDSNPMMNAGSSAMVGVGIVSTGLAFDGAFIYQSAFDKLTWSGSLRKIAVSVNDNGFVQLAATPSWDAAEILSGKDGKLPLLTAAARKIFTMRLAADGSADTVEFEWNKLATSQKTFLNLSPVSNKVDDLGVKRTEFLRGARNHELGQSQGIFRQRGSVLGDIVNSRPVYVGTPAQHIAGSDYQEFYAQHKNRTQAVYVGANDGMLHAFDATSGAELFAYIPNALFEDLGQLSRPDYAHRSYVDGAMAIAEARVQGNWKTVLVSGMGGGAQGVFALDVSNPAEFDGGAGALWEFTDHDDPDMGNVFNVPVIAKFKTKVVKGVPEYRHFAMVANGLNNYVDDGSNNFNPDAPAVLFLLSLDKKPVDKWQIGVNYFKFQKPILEPGLPNGLSSPAVVVGEDGAVRYAYAGDLQGNLWRFDFTGAKPWLEKNAGTTPLFTATDDTLARQPISTQPKVVFAPGGGYVVLFGTGKFSEETDIAPDNFRSQSFYGIFDANADSYVVSGRSQMASRTLSKSAGDILHLTGKQFSYGATAGGKKGWYFDFFESEKTGERSVSNPVTASGQLIFNSLIPCGNPCLQGGGRSYALNALTGMPIAQNESGRLSMLGLLNEPVVMNIGTQIEAKNAFGKAMAKKQHAVIDSGTGGANGIIAAGQGADAKALAAIKLPVKRFSWREIVNWQELRATFGKKQ